MTQLAEQFPLYTRKLDFEKRVLKIEQDVWDELGIKLEKQVFNDKIA